MAYSLIKGYWALWVVADVQHPEGPSVVLFLVELGTQKPYLVWFLDT